MRRTLLASLLPAAVIAGAWLGLEDPRLAGEAVAVVALALLPSLVRPGAARIGAAVGSALGATWIAFGAQPWELVPLRDERVLAPALRDAARGVVDFYEVFLPFEPTPNPEMHSLVLCAIFAFVLAMALFVAARRPLGAAAVTVAGVGWPATLLGGKAVAAGALALVAALAIPLILRATSARTVLVGGLIGSLVVAGAAWTSSATTLARDAVVDWETWDIRGQVRQASNVQFIWDSNYEGIVFPSEKTVVLRVEGPSTPHYWRTTTLDVFDENHWFEHLFWLDQVDHSSRTLVLPQLTPARARRPESWLEQHVRVEALVDDHLAAAGTPVALDGRHLGTVFLLSGGVLRAGSSVEKGESYRIWSYAPDPTPRSLARAPARYPVAASTFLEVDGREFPPFGLPGRERVVQALFDDPSFAAFARHIPMYREARRVAGRAATPYAAVIALESWLRQTGGFTYDESPPRGKGAPLVSFVTQTKTGYCQHFAGAMAAMLRMLGIPARVAVGFTSGTLDDGTWVVTDHDAHAWVEVWFAGIGWVPFDPTPGRGTLGGVYSSASTSNDEVGQVGPGRARAELFPATAVGLGRGRLCRIVFAPSSAVARSASRSYSRPSGSSRSGQARRSCGVPATSHATHGGLGLRAAASSRTSSETRVSTFHRTRRSSCSSRPSTTSSGSTAVRSPSLRHALGSGRPRRSSRVRPRHGRRCAGSSRPRGVSFRSGPASAGSCPFARCDHTSS